MGKRGRVSAGTACRVDADLWCLVLMHCERSPSSVFKMICASKEVCVRLGPLDAWWLEFTRRVLRYQSGLKRSQHLGSLTWLLGRGMDPCGALRLSFGLRCIECGSKCGHRIFGALLCRLCRGCVGRVLISNRVLYHAHGVHFADFLEEFCARGGRVLPYRHTRKRLHVLQQLSRNPIDHAAREREKLLFFTAADFWFSLADNAPSSATAAPTAAITWQPGGPFEAERPLTLREGFTVERLERIQALLSAHVRQTFGHLPWRKPRRFGVA